MCGDGDGAPDDDIEFLRLSSLDLAWDCLGSCLFDIWRTKKRWVGTRMNGRSGVSIGNVSSSVVWSERAGKNFVGVLARRVSPSSGHDSVTRP